MKPEPLNEECGTCRFWWFPQGNGGQCYRFPPTSHVVSNANGDTAWETARPWVERNEFCGEWKAR